jgi:transposase-like protein
MNFFDLNKKYNTTTKCAKYLEKLRWNNKPVCTFCGSSKATLRKNNKPIPEYHCNTCNKDFTVKHETIFENTQLPLEKWFLIIQMMLNAKMGLSAKEVERSTGISYKAAWYSMMRIRCAMIDTCNIELDHVVEMDEAYLGGKPRHRTQGQTDKSVPSLATVATEQVKRGRGTKKTPVVGIVERNGKIVLKVIERLNFKNMFSLLQENVKTDTAILMTDENPTYFKFDEFVEHFHIKHKEKQYVKGSIHTNTIEGFWSLLKESIKGNQRAISKKYLPFYLVSSQYVYNYRNYSGNLFDKFMKEALATDKSKFYNNYKPVKEVKKLVYKKCKPKKKAS